MYNVYHFERLLSINGLNSQMEHCTALMCGLLGVTILYLFSISKGLEKLLKLPFLLFHLLYYTQTVVNM